ncbi:DNA replication complex GINS protein SLD5 [Condylostylus longicornis]|uniref:DNA replication complex GINS protein SLD5 n=1 Tax=Condylostylus longicornis TaxID=2530218 RepID=UPI00244DA7BE|nr:DNA replication complex GINS protein SLD5 [Condylostylus longicornis]XP_055375298.1 DNA replication complex GINS protein SLD5 [Condylostylus longicornis]
MSEDIIDFESDEELITAQKVLEKLQCAWLNEKFAPDILPIQEEIIELMMGQISHMEENMVQLDKNDLRYIAHRMEIERIRYLITSYLRCRLKKIEKYTSYIISEDEKSSEDNKRLSQGELTFAQELFENTQNLFNRIALQYMPNMQRSTADCDKTVRPNLMSHVFLKAKTTVSGVVIGADDEEVDLAEGSQHIIPYQLISDLVLNDKVQLI